MAFKLKGRSTVQGTSGHNAALKQQLDDDAREKAADEARKKSASTQELKNYLKEMDELLDKGVSPEEAKQMLAEKTAPAKKKATHTMPDGSVMPGAKHSPTKQVKEKEKGSSSDMDAEAAREDSVMIEIAKKRGYTMKVVDGKIVKVPVDKKTGKPAPNKGLDRSKAKRNDPDDGVVSASEASGGMFMKSPNKQKSDPRDGNNATYEKKAGVNFQKAKDKIKKLGLTSSDAQFKKIMADARKKNKALADSLRNN
tara:strand:- start:581 stop:1342 length:762 start_codon:yes stop_codon:yes gene_type:complete